MKKFLSILGAISLTASSTSMVIACKTDQKEEDSTKLTDLKTAITNTDLGNFTNLPDNQTIMNKLVELNQDHKDNLKLENLDLTLTTTGTNAYREAKLTPKTDSKIFSGETLITWNATVEELAMKKAKSLLLADQFELDAKTVSKNINFNLDELYDVTFDLDSVKNLDIAKGKVGNPGGIWSEFIKDDTDLTSIISELPDVIKGLVTETDGSVKGETGSEQIVNIINKISSSMSLVSGLMNNLFILLDTIIPLLPNQINIGESFDEISKGITDFVNNNLKEEDVKPILSAISKGTDSSRLSDSLLIRDLPLIFIVSLVNAIGYATSTPEKEYQEIKVIFEKHEADDVLDSIANLMSDWIKEDLFSKFDFSKNTAKIIENFVFALNTLNVLLTIYRTPEIDLTKEIIKERDEIVGKDEKGNDIIERRNYNARSEYLFSDELDNAEFYTSITRGGRSQDGYLLDFDSDKTNGLYAKYLKTNLKGFNLGELITNINYYLNGKQTNLQKLLYVLLGTGGAVNPALSLVVKVLSKELKIDDPLAIGGISGLLASFIGNILTNKKIGLTEFKEGTLYKNQIKPILIGKQPDGSDGLISKELLEEEIEPMLDWIDDYFGDNSFDTLFSGDLIPILEKLTPLIGKETLKPINDWIDKNLKNNNHKLNLDTFLNKISLKEYLSWFGANLNNGYYNPNLPTHLNKYTNLPISEIIKKIADFFEINEEITSKELEDYYLDFSIAEKLLNELLYDIKDETGKVITQSLLNQILEILKTNKENNLQEIMKLVGLIQITETNKNPITGVEETKTTNFIEFDSFLGRLIQFIAPKAGALVKNLSETDTRKVIEINEELADIHDNLTWILKGLINFLPDLGLIDDLNPFINQVLKSEGIFEQETSTKVETDNSYNISLTFDPTKVKFDDQTTLEGSKWKYDFVVKFNSTTKKYDFASVVKTKI